MSSTGCRHSSPKDYDRWLERDSDRPPIDLLRPFESERMVKWACNPRVGSVRIRAGDAE